MKTKDLIDKLQKIDPSGEIECCIGNEDIWFVEKEMAYWDGDLQIVIFDENRKIKSVGKTSKGFKIVIHPISFDAACELSDGFKNVEIDTSGCGSEDRITRFLSKIEELKKEHEEYKK